MGRRFIISTAILDLAALAVAVLVGLAFVPDFGQGVEPIDVAPLFGAMVGGAVVGSYVSARSWGEGAPRPSYGRAVSIVSIGVSLTALAVVTSRMYWSRPFFVITSMAWLGLALAHRAYRRRRPWAESIVAISNEKELIEDLRSAPHANLVDALDPRGEPPTRPFPPGTVMAVDLRAVLSDTMAQYISSVHLAGRSMRGFTSVYEEHTGRLPIVHLMEGWELTEPLEAKGVYVNLKRAIDIVLVALTAPIWLPLCGLIALVIRLDSNGPAIFAQERAGRGGKPFTLYKFRTMVDEADANGPQFALPGDDRLTRVGSGLRRFRVDELPQLWNVLKGDLSLVGPRPEQLPFVDRFSQTIPFYTHRHLVRPGVTGWAQVNFGYADNEVDTVEKLSYDLYYLKHVSPWLDISILGKSVWTVLSGFGAQ
ncbi:MAG: sugar transferase [Acidimicrobiia bacterium]|nr:sugar transferase [Acidimicrobiia bacterium]NNF11471.1 sugar transferase [Acidimicrobiia bacterium]NNL71323.1 sugar transferase [Acidimicrobiia bacterium]